MSKRSDNYKTADAPLIAFGSWRELHEWDDKVHAREGCPLLEEQFVLNCYALFRNEELNPVVSSIYSDGYAGHDFEVTGEVPVDDVGFDLCSLPMFWGIVEGEEVALFPEEIFVKW